MNTLPKIAELVVPVLRVLNDNGPLNHKHIESKIVEMLGIPNDLRNVLRLGNRTELNYRLSWARTKAKNLGYIEKQSSGVWILTPKGNASLEH